MSIFEVKNQTSYYLDGNFNNKTGCIARFERINLKGSDWKSQNEVKFNNEQPNKSQSYPRYSVFLSLHFVSFSLLSVSVLPSSMSKPHPLGGRRYEGIPAYLQREREKTCVCRVTYCNVCGGVLTGSLNCTRENSSHELRQCSGRYSAVAFASRTAQHCP